MLFLMPFRDGPLSHECKDLVLKAEHENWETFFTALCPPNING